MVLLVEQERLYSDEAGIVNDATQYSGGGAVDWTSIKSYTFTLSKALVLLIKDQYAASLGYGSHRIVVDGIPIWASGQWMTNGWTSARTTPDIYIILSSGSHTVDFQAAGTNASTSWEGVKNIVISQLNFNDKISGGPWDSGSVVVTQSILTTLQNQNVTIPASRQLPIGTIKNYTMFLRVFAADVSASPSRRTHLKSVGQGNDSGKINLMLYLNDAQASWTGGINDDNVAGSENPTYGIGTYGEYIATVSPNQTLNIKVKAFTDAASVSARCFAVVFLCPWITPAAAYQPVTLNFPQGSTFYAYLEPLNENAATKASKIGKTRFASFGDATDYYSTASGTGVLSHTYTFDLVYVATAEWVISSTTFVCVSYIGADVR